MAIGPKIYSQFMVNKMAQSSFFHFIKSVPVVYLGIFRRFLYMLQIIVTMYGYRSLWKYKTGCPINGISKTTGANCVINRYIVNDYIYPYYLQNNVVLAV